MRHVIFIGLLLFMGSNTEVQALTLSSLFSDHMVLQRDKPVRLWGEAPASQTVSVNVLGKRYSTQAAQNGDWEIILPAHNKAGPFNITIVGDETKTIQDVYFGEVWIASGQSNMEWKLKGDVIGKDDELATANRPLIRFFDVPYALAATKQTLSLIHI